MQEIIGGSRKNKERTKNEMETQIITKDSLTEPHKNIECRLKLERISGWSDTVKQFAEYNAYISLDMIQTGKRMHDIFIKNRCNVKDIQNLLNLACPQSVYRWIKGQALPSIDNLYTLAKIFQVHIDDMLVSKDIDKI